MWQSRTGFFESSGKASLLHRSARPGRVAASLLAHLSPRVAKRWLPDDVVVVEELPHTATGKIPRTKLRAAFAGHFAVA
jgi:acyl-coenzyme A synthetase/AMP-(fatty) acid ligase